MPVRTPVPVKLVVAPVRAIRGGDRGRPMPEAPAEPAPSAELIEIRQLRAELTPQPATPAPPPHHAPPVGEDHLRPWLFRHRRILRVFYVALVLAASKVLILAPSILPVIGLAVAACLVYGAWLWVRKTSTATILTDRQRATLADAGEEVHRKVEALTSPRAGAIATIVCAAVWWLRPDDLKPAAISLAVSALVVAGVRKWRFRVRVTVEVIDKAPEFGPREAWITHVPAGDKHLERAIITGPTDVINPKGDRIGFTLTVELPEGSPAAAKFAAGVKDRTATTFGVGADMDVLIKLDPRNAARFDVTVLDVPGSSALDHIHRYEGSTFDIPTGSWQQAVRADWSPARLQAYDPKHGARHIHVSGETGGGKSETLETMLRNVTASGVIVPLIIDIAQTLTDWAGRAQIYVTTREDALQLLKNMLTLHHHRMGKMAKMRLIVDGQDMGARKVYPVDREHPMYQGYFDEFQHQIADHKVDPLAKAILKAVEDVTTQLRKTMQGVVLAGQATGLVAGFGNNNLIRTQCQAGGMIAHRNNNESGRQVFGNGLAADPSTIPMGLFGAAFCASVIDQQDSMARNIWTEHPALFDHEIDIPQIPADELAILMRGLSIAGRAEGPEGVEESVEVEDVPAVIVERPSLTVINTPASDQLKEAMKAWARELGRPVRRQEFLAEFRDVRGVASRYKVDKALEEMKDAEEFEADAEGYYTLKEAA